MKLLGRLKALTQLWRWRPLRSPWPALSRTGNLQKRLLDPHVKFAETGFPTVS